MDAEQEAAAREKAINLIVKHGYKPQIAIRKVDLNYNYKQSKSLRVKALKLKAKAEKKR